MRKKLRGEAIAAHEARNHRIQIRARLVNLSTGILYLHKVRVLYICVIHTFTSMILNFLSVIFSTLYSVYIEKRA